MTCNGNDGDVDDSLVDALGCMYSDSFNATGVFRPLELSLVLWAEDGAVAVAASTSN
jgi:hypothetical protein